VRQHDPAVLGAARAVSAWSRSRTPEAVLPSARVAVPLLHPLVALAWSAAFTKVDGGRDNQPSHSGAKVPFGACRSHSR
jgi:hypothetical protein